jgi:hypothetical protein
LLTIRFDNLDVAELGRLGLHRSHHVDEERLSHVW